MQEKTSLVEGEHTLKAQVSAFHDPFDFESIILDIAKWLIYFMCLIFSVSGEDESGQKMRIMERQVSICSDSTDPEADLSFDQVCSILKNFCSCCCSDVRFPEQVPACHT